MKPVTNVAASIRQRILNEAKRRGESFDYVASLYARERFLARLAASAHRNRFILKGATVFALWAETHRPTRDLDFLGRGNFDPGEAASVIRDIVEGPAGDGLLFDSAGITAETIREADEYRGVRVHLTATLDGARIRLQIDIGVGDVVTPPARQATLPTILDDFSPPRVRVYPPETIVAEKLQAMVKLGIVNSRMKDFFDVYVLASKCQFDEALLSKAVNRTFKRRRTAIPREAFALSEDFYEDRGKQTQWLAFLRKSGVNAPHDFTALGKVLRTFLAPVLVSAGSGMPGERRWRSRGWRKRR